MECKYTFKMLKCQMSKCSKCRANVAKCRNIQWKMQNKNALKNAKCHNVKISNYVYVIYNQTLSENLLSKSYYQIKCVL